MNSRSTPNVRRAARHASALGVCLVLAGCAPAQFQTGGQKFGRGKHEEAVSRLRQGLAKHPRGSAAARARIQLAIASRRAAEARCRRGASHFRQGALLDADKDFGRALELDSTNTLAIKMLGQVDRHKASTKALVQQARDLLQAKQYDPALDRLDRARDMARTFPQMEALHAQALEASFQQHFAAAGRTFAQARYDTALAEYSIALTRKPQHAECVAGRERASAHVKATEQSRLAADHLSEGEIEAALALYERASTLAPALAIALEGESDARRQLAGRLMADANALAGTGNEPDLRRALALLQHSGELHPDDDAVQVLRRDAARELAERLHLRAQRLLAADPLARCATALHLLDEAYTLSPQLESIQADRTKAQALTNLKCGLWLSLQVGGDQEHARRCAEYIRARIEASALPHVRLDLAPADRQRDALRKRLAALGVNVGPEGPGGMDMVQVQVTAEPFALPTPQVSLAKQIPSRRVSARRRLVTPEWDKRLAEHGATRTALDSVHQRYARERGEREAAHLAHLTADAGSRAADTDFALKRELHGRLTADAASFARCRLPRAAAAAQAAVAALDGPMLAAVRQASDRRRRLTAAKSALGRADTTLAATLRDARRLETRLSALQLHLDRHPRERMVDTETAYTVTQSDVRLHAAVRYRGSIAEPGQPSLVPIDVRVTNHVQARRVTGAHRLDLAGQANRSSHLPPPALFADEVRQAGLMRLGDLIVSFAATRHQRFFQAGLAGAQQRPDDAVELHLCFLAADRGRSPERDRVAASFVEERLRGKTEKTAP